ncbi:hypothetical protein UFOVP964_103 [uncultured Caudovirales phage]|uniref:Uncharacterized protein n=1 Tax=uncultured Caudovirales phage TaxID=2100421 RepID=A0A6J5QWQ7_9CAUD|nr:hypothetical protein UFOVP854_103 [uncultured Caudovirales phage]CAB4174959.1 hypothetical protein UFOVP964_103 [uncultured Caudovirales phage]CAB4179279.1 hypothetical protein UFOVP1034_55 [uncultured Caudovirales phage]CAB4189099.1 hypothetical protein UFOVP1177_55 [uncultured Caudovirales phage]CAB4193226.1 hypothetical protein UFOVP1243_42 [uncultured Caudovirales phage]
MATTTIATVDEQGVMILVDDDVTSYFQLVSLLNKKENK